MNTIAFVASGQSGLSGLSEAKKKNIHLCRYCIKVFANKFTLKDHITRFHEGDKTFACDLCGKKFTFDRDLKQHKNKHRNRNAFVCTVCEKTYSNEDKLNEHKITHNLVTPQFECDHCGKEFLKEAYFNQHLKTHSAIYPCPQCQKVLKSKYSFEQHMRKHMPASPRFECNICHLTYVNKERLKSHQKRKHADPRNDTAAPAPKVSKASKKSSTATSTATKNHLNNTGFVTHFTLL